MLALVCESVCMEKDEIGYTIKLSIKPERQKCRKNRFCWMQDALTYRRIKMKTPCFA
jgi:hypothetical protein